ncbi:MAG TPA: site-specific DNA-methyltransferase [Devosia sp.]|nr:site-specific DNA-methyltransferase [Devosia sp.]
MVQGLEKSWFAIDGELDEIGFDGFADDRFPSELAERVIAAFSREGDWILDPFAGLGTTLHAAQRLGRHAVGFEPNSERADWAQRGLYAPNMLVNAGIETIDQHNLPAFNLVFTSPPYVTVNLEDDPWGPSYFDDMREIFERVRQHLAPKAMLVVEVSNIDTDDGYRPLVWQFGTMLGEIFALQREIVRTNTGPTPAGPGVNQSSLLVFRHG